MLRSAASARFDNMIEGSSGGDDTSADHGAGNANQSNPLGSDGVSNQAKSSAETSQLNHLIAKMKCTSRGTLI